MATVVEDITAWFTRATTPPSALTAAATGATSAIDEAKTAGKVIVFTQIVTTALLGLLVWKLVFRRATRRR